MGTFGLAGAAADAGGGELILAELLGKEAVKDFDGLSYVDYLVPFFAAMACVQNKSYEEVEQSFRES